MKPPVIDHRTKEPLKLDVNSLSIIYKRLLSHLQGKSRIDRRELRKIRSDIQETITNSVGRTRVYCSKIEAILQIIFNTRSHISRSISQGKLVVREAPLKKSTHGDILETIHQDLQSILSDGSKISTNEIREYQKRASQFKSSTNNVQQLLQVRGILRFLSENRQKFAQSVEKGEVTFYDNESFSSHSAMMLREDEPFILNNISGDATIDIPTNLLSNQDFHGSTPSESECDVYGQQYRSILAASRENSELYDQILEKNSSDDNYFKVPALPNVGSMNEDALAGYYTQIEGGYTERSSSETPDLDSLTQHHPLQLVTTEEDDDTTQSMIFQPIPSTAMTVQSENRALDRLESKEIAIANLYKAEKSLSEVFETITKNRSKQRGIDSEEDDRNDDALAENVRNLEELTVGFHRLLIETQSTFLSLQF